MKRILALAALVAPLAFAPLAFGADDPDATFYKKAAEGGLFEVDTGNQAEKSSNNQQVKDFGAMLVKDHTAANDKLKALAASKNISLPSSASVGERSILYSFANCDAPQESTTPPEHVPSACKYCTGDGDPTYTVTLAVVSIVAVPTAVNV